MPWTATFSSVPSLQSRSPSQIHSSTRHSLLWEQRCLVRQAGELVQPSSSEWSQQSGWPSQRNTLVTHWPLVHLKSVALQSSSSTEREEQSSQGCPTQAELINQWECLDFLVQWWRTTARLITAIPAVPLPITEEAVRDAAAPPITQVRTAIHLLGTSLFIRAILTLRHTITHLALLYALPSVGTLELVCRTHGMIRMQNYALLCSDNAPINF